MKINRAYGLAPLVRVMSAGLALSVVHIAFAAGPGWVSSFEQALEMARQQKKPIFVDFSTSWCGVCKQMDRSTLADPTIIQRLDNFVKVKVDGDARQDLCSAYGVAAYPTFIHLDPNGRMLDKREGYMRVQELASTLDRTYQSVAVNTSAIAQAPRNGQQPAAAGAEAETARENEVAAASAPATNQLLSAPGAPTSRNTRTVAQEGRGDARISNDNLAYDKADPRLQGSVYAMGASPTSERRSRFGGVSTEQNGLRELAEATAEPGAIEQSDSPVREDEAKAQDVASEKEVPADVNDDKKLAAKADDEKAEEEKKSAKAAEDAKLIAETKAKVEADQKALAAKPKEVASASPSPVIESRLKGISEAELPKPLLSRTVSGGAQAVQTSAKAASSNETAASGDPLATIRRIQGDGAKPAEPAAAVKVTAKTQEIAAEKPTPKAEEAKPAEKIEAKADKSETKAEEELKKEPAKEVASASTAKASSTSSSSADDKKSDATPDKPKSSSEPKTAEGASRSDIDRWMKEADTKLVSDKKKEARAMYNKVVDNDPKNQFGKSDMAYVKMVSLIVDKDNDLLRRQAYNKIKEFEARFPESDHKDYYTLIRAILAADLGETNEAHRLLGTYAERFPESKYRTKAHEIWKDLPPVKKESAADKKSKSTRSSADSGSSRRNSDG